MLPFTVDQFFEVRHAVLMMSYTHEIVTPVVTGRFQHSSYRRGCRDRRSRTVRNYLSNTIGKLGARNRLDAIRIAEDAG